MPILLLSKEIAGVRALVVEVVADDLAFPADVAAWCQAKGFTVEWSEQAKDGFHARLRRLTGESR
jgi:TusA-related sulfurtransferase